MGTDNENSSLACTGLQDYGMRIAAACREIIALPKANKETLKFLLQHLLR